VDVVPFVILVYQENGGLEKQHVYVNFAVKWGDMEKKLPNA
jgi:hypothetical protein